MVAQDAQRVTLELFSVALCTPVRRRSD